MSDAALCLTLAGLGAYHGLNPAMGWLTKLDAGEDGSLGLDPELFVEFPHGERPHQVRLQGGDASSDSFCFPDR